MTYLLLNVEEAAKRLGGVSRWSIYSWMSTGRLKKTKIGRRVMIAENDLQDFVDRCNPETVAESNDDSRGINEPNVQ
jgi:excisionase family DNA binding protein